MWRSWPTGWVALRLDARTRESLEWLAHEVLAADGTSRSSSVDPTPPPGRCYRRPLVRQSENPSTRIRTTMTIKTTTSVCVIGWSQPLGMGRRGYVTRAAGRT